MSMSFSCINGDVRRATLSKRYRRSTLTGTIQVRFARIQPDRTRLIAYKRPSPFDMNTHRSHVWYTTGCFGKQCRMRSTLIRDLPLILLRKCARSLFDCSALFMVLISRLSVFGIQVFKCFFFRAVSSLPRY